MDAQKETFLEEARELLVKLESALLELEETPKDTDHIDSAFRALHTIKGSGAMFGFDDIAEFTHDIETIFELVRDGKVAVTRDLVSLSLSVCDQIKVMLEAYVGGPHAVMDESERILTAFRAMVPELRNSTEALEAVPENIVYNGADEGRGVKTTYRINFRPDIKILKNGTNPIHLLNELRVLGDCDVTAHLEAIPVLNDYDPEACYTFWDIVLTTDHGINKVRDVFIFVESTCEVNIDIIDDSRDVNIGVGTKRIGEILMDRGDVSSEKLQDLLEKQKRIGELLVEEKVVNGSKVDAALAEQKHVKRTREKIWKKSQTTSVRVPTEKLDELVDLVGELVTIQARLTQRAMLENEPEIMTIAEDVENITNGLRDNTMSIRMVQIGITFKSFRRLVRDLSAELGKNIILKTEGGETELDKTVIDRLNDPMVHVIRNCIDHGIESPDIRKDVNKSEQGTVCLTAVHSGAHVLIKISDDGAGLDPEMIRDKAVKNNIIAKDTDLSEKELFQLVFEPGFSTAQKVTDVSGRGVGLDVVKRNVEALRGSVEIRSSKGEGTTITLKLPLTLAIIEGFLVEIGGNKFIMPLSSVEECVELTKEDITKTHGRDILNVRGEIIPYIRLRKSFNINGDVPDLEHVVITGINGDRIGFVVDNVIGGHQTVIKSLGHAMKHSQDVSGATILGDGTVALILDIDKISHERVAVG